MMFAYYSKAATLDLRNQCLNPVNLTEIQFHAMDAARKLQPGIQFFGQKRDAMFDKVCGTDRIRNLFESDAPLSSVLAAWRDGVEEFRTRRKPYLLYK